MNPRGIFVLSMTATMALGCTKIRDGIDKVVPKKALIKAPPTTRTSKEDATAFGQRLLAAARTSDPNAVADLIDWDAFARRSTADLPVGEEFITGFVGGARKAAMATGFINQLVADASKQVSTKVIRVKRKDGERRVVIRCVLAKGFNYLELVLSTGPDGSVKAVDWWTLTGGELASAASRRFLIPVAADLDRSILERLTTGQRSMTLHIKDLQRMQAALAAGDHAGGLKIYDELPEDIQREKVVLLMRLPLAEALGDKVYSAAIDDLAKYHPTDPAAAVALLDRHILRSDTDAALKTLDVIEMRNGADPYLDVVRSSIALLGKRTDDAAAMAKRAVEADESMIEAHWALVSAYLSADEHEKTASQLLKMQTAFGLTFNFENIPDYEKFLKSSEYRRVAKQLSGAAGSGR